MHLSLPLFDFTQHKNKCASLRIHLLPKKKLTNSVCQVSLVVKYFCTKIGVGCWQDKNCFTYCKFVKGLDLGTRLSLSHSCFLSLCLSISRSSGMTSSVDWDFKRWLFHSFDYYWLDQILIITPGSANLEFWRKNKTKQTNKNKKILLAVFLTKWGVP